MKKLITSLALALFIVGSLGSSAQGCDGAIKLGDLKDFCSGQKAYNNNAANFTGASNLGDCYTTTNLKNEVWFKFTAIGSEVSFTVKTNGADGTIKNPNMTLHDACTGSPLACAKGTTNDKTVLYQSGLTTGKEYYIRVITTTGDAGTFTICIDNKTPPPNPQADCDKAVKLCDKNPVHLTGLSGTGTKNSELGFSEACIMTETNSCWYYWKCSKSGPLTFDLAPNDGLADMDFIVWSADKQEDLCVVPDLLKPSPRKVERCSATNCPTPNMSTGLKGNPGQTSEPAGCNSTPKDDGYVDQLNMVAGKWYMLFIINANSAEGFSINFGGTGEFEGPEAKIHADKVTICEGNVIKFDKSTSTGYDPGKLEWTFTGGTPSTGTGDGPFDIKYDTPGNYVAIVKATGGKCVSTDYVNITVNEGATVSVAPQEVCEGGEVTLVATPSVTGGTYKWSSNANDATTSSVKVKPTTSTTYTVVYSLAGCDAEGQGVVTVNKNPEVTVNSENICPGSSVDLKATLKETVGKYTFDWAPGIPDKTQTITVSPTVKTTYTVTVKSEEGCIGTATGTVDINGKLSVKPGNDTTICKDGTVHFLVKPNGAGYTYKWTTSNSTTLSDPTIYNPTAVVSTTTTFSVAVVSDKGCTGEGSMTVSIDPVLNGSVTPSAVSCSACDGKITANASGGTAPYTYSWTGGCNTAVCSNLCAGSYTVTIKDKIGCTIEADTSLVAPANITLQTSFVQSICGQSNGSATVIASAGSGGFTYEWNDKDKQKTATATNLPAGKYCVTVTDISNCKQTACVDIVDIPGFTSSVTSIVPTSCYGVCDGTAEVAVSGAVAPVTYSWNTTPGAQTGFKATGLCAGDYVVSIKDAVGCQDKLNVKIVQPARVYLDPLPVVKLCIGSSATLNVVAHGGDGNYKYTWTEVPDTTASIVVTPTVSTDYHVSIRDGRGCVSDPLTIKVVVNPPLKVKVSGNTKICKGDSTKLTAVGSGGNGGPYTYTWTPNVVQISSSVTVSPPVTTMYIVTVKDECGTPAAKDSILITVNAIPVIKFAGDTLKGCDPVTVNFTDSTTASPGVITNWKWDFGDGTGSDSKNPKHVFSTTGTKTSLYTVTLTVTSDNRCKSTLTKKDYIRVFPVPDASFEAPLSTSIVNPTVHFINTSVGATIWEWNFGDSLSTHTNNTSSLYSPDHVYSEIGQYLVKLVVKNYGGCMDSTELPIRIDPKFVLYIPNAFTPNGDGDNDMFFAKGEYINEFEMRIFDRWGNMIFYSDAIDKGWNGKVNNTSAELCQEDVYVYQVRIKDNMNKGHKYVGKVTLLKGR